MNYAHDVTIKATAMPGFAPHYGGSIRVVIDGVTFDFDPHRVIRKTIHCFDTAIKQELERLGMQGDQKLHDAVYDGFCEYLSRLVSGKF